MDIRELEAELYKRVTAVIEQNVEEVVEKLRTVEPVDKKNYYHFEFEGADFVFAYYKDFKAWMCWASIGSTTMHGLNMKLYVDKKGEIIWPIQEKS